MILNLFRRKPDNEPVERLYAQIMAAARRRELFLDGYGVADTVDGRFDLVALHLFLVTRRLAALPQPGPDLAQALTDRIFLGFDRAFREMGVGDLAVPKRMKKLGADYTGRCAAYAAALAPGGEALDAALARNVYGSADATVAQRLARYVLAAEKALSAMPLPDFQRGAAPFPDPASIA
jgi:cytochrome b pre-mRNA-processing protein 3